jgi:pimeloyl-ACP methyl ester carboxylesterase
MRVEVDGVGIHYEVTGEGRPVVLLHGFPDTGRLWRHQVPALARAGLRVIVPDLRGYGRSDRPADVGAYALPALAGDVLAVLADAGVQRAHVVGHDWGAALAWGLAALAPDRVDHLVVLSVGHPSTMRAGGFGCA